jgi:signal transduction histidine kinase
VQAERGGSILVFVPQDLPTPAGTPAAAILTIAGVLVVLTLAYHAIRRLFRPIETIRAGVARIGSGDLDHRLDIRRRDELGELAGAINAMADDIRDMLEAKRDLLLAISHELRSPLTRARLHAELLAEGPDQEALLADLAEMETLVGELLESERLRGRHAVLSREAVDPTELLSSLVEASFGDAEVRLDLDPAGTYLALDPARIRLLARNLIANALRHTPPGAPAPVLSSHVDASHWTLAVSDSGPGVPEHERERLTEPFYRADPSRQRASGGVGLGLYLSRAIAEAHGGGLDIDSASTGGPEAGTRVRVRIPIGDA